ncbi:MAG: hypothetical protein ACE5Q6_11080 [Dehalococcoidia bacterium]
MLSKGILNVRFLTLLYMAAFLLFSTACFTLVRPTTAPEPTSAPPTNANPGPRPLSYELELIADPREGADFVVNPKADAQGAYRAGTAATIDVLLRPGWSIEQWVGPVYAISGETAKVNMDQDQTVVVRMVQEGTRPTPRPQPTATPRPDPDPTYALTVNRHQVTGSGVRLANGTVKVDPEPNAPRHLYQKGTPVRLTAVADDGYEFRGWEGACLGVENHCLLRMNGPKNVGVKFAKVARTYSLDFIPVPENGGKIGVDPKPNADNGKYLAGTEVKLLAVANRGHRFQGWQGDCTGSKNVCSVTMSEDKQVAGIFQAIGELPTLTIRTFPEAGGRVRVNPEPNAPDQHYLLGTVVNLVAIPAEGFEFRGWEGACSGSAPGCRVTMNASQFVFAGFAKKTYSLSVSAVPERGGRVGVTPPPNAADGQYLHGTRVTLAAEPAPGFGFHGWGGDCSGDGRFCRIDMDENKRVSANFARRIHSLTLSSEPAQGGSVEVSPSSGDVLGADALYRFAHGTQVKLKAVPSPGYQFSQWRGDCQNAAGISDEVCVLLMDSSKSAVATFELKSYSLTVNGILVTEPDLLLDHGSVNIAPEPNFGDGLYLHGTEVVLTAMADDGYQVSEWKGACADGSDDGIAVPIDECALIMTEDQQVEVEFMLKPVPVDDVNLEPSADASQP